MVLSYSCKNKSNVTSHEYSNVQVRQSDLLLIVHLRGISKCKISLSPMTGARALSPIGVLEEVRYGEPDTLIISGNYLPGEFTLSFDCMENDEDLAYHSERILIALDQDIELWVNPIYCNNEDSTWFRSDEKENTACLRFFRENAKLREPLMLLQKILWDYDDFKSEFYGKKVKEYEKSRISYNKWIGRQVLTNQTLFSSQIFEFQKISKIDWKSAKPARRQSQRDNYLEEVSFSNPMIIETAGMKKLIDEYVELFDEPATDSELRDSLLMLAGSMAMEKIRFEHPYVYGWITDYFYDLYEENNLIQGIIMLQPYLEDPNCLTSQKRIFQQRSVEKERISIGKEAPDFQFINKADQYYMFNEYKTTARFKMILFWNTDCWKCIALSKFLYSWHQQETNSDHLDVFTVNLSNDLIKSVWEKRVDEMPDWEHMIDKGGIDSEVANVYCVLSTPLMVLIDAHTNEIVALPLTVEELNAAINELK
jgi:hypothetical protein